MSFTSISVIMAVIVTNIQEKTKECTWSRKTRLGKFCRTLFLSKIAKILGMERQGKELLKHMIKLDMREKKRREKEKDQYELF